MSAPRALPLVVDATAWTGRRLAREEQEEATLARAGVFPIDRAAVPPLYAETDALAAALGIPPPRLFYRPAAPWFMAGGIAAASGHVGTVILTEKLLRLSPDARRAVLAHEFAHIAAGHGRERFSRWFCAIYRSAGLGALVLSAWLASPALILAAVVASGAAHAAVLRYSTRCEREADAAAVGIMGSVIPLLPASEPARGWKRLAFLWTAYPTRRPWLHEMAAAELIAMHNHIAARGLPGR